MKSANSNAIKVRAANGDYQVVCGRWGLRRAAQEISRLGKFSSVHILSSPKVWRVIEKKVRRGWPASLVKGVHLFDDAEAAKNLCTVERLALMLVRAGADRHSLLVAVGGGVVGDVGGLVARVCFAGV